MKAVGEAVISAEMPRMTTASTRPKWSTWRSSGVVRLWMPESIWLTLPNSVATPVATTTPLAWPYTTSVPE